MIMNYYLVHIFLTKKIILNFLFSTIFCDIMLLLLEEGEKTQMEEKVINILREQKETVSCMESCTGGMLASTLTNVSGSSDVLQVSLVTYSNHFKEKFGVPHEVIEKHSVYSIETAREMAKHVSCFANSTWGIGITGQIGRIDPQNKGQQINTIYFSIYQAEQEKYWDTILQVEEQKTRKENKEKIVEKVLEQFYQVLKEG